MNNPDESICGLLNSWNEDGKRIKMNTVKPLFGAVVLEVGCGIFINTTSSFYR